MPTWKHAIAALLLLVLVAIIVLNAPSSRDPRAATRDDPIETPGDLRPTTSRLRESERPLALERLSRIQKELSDLRDHAWAGVYGWDDVGGESARLSIAPNSGFAYFRVSPGSPSDLNHGAVLSVKPSRIQIEPAIDPAQNVPRTFGIHELAPLDPDLFPVRWGARRYLIAKSEMQAFCNAVNAGREGPKPRFAHRLDEGSRAEPNGLPIVPDAYTEWLLAEPIASELIQVFAPEGEANAKQARAMNALLNVGRAQGVRPGMLFWMTEARGYDFAEVLECDEQTSKVVFTLDVSHTRDTEPLKVGWKVSTRAPKR
ncbi:MAG: hypothetical protein IT453_05600 [Planctomycetes bacterium]|nr:hypothetical protein [Planctomycetota bacterium]